MALYYIRSFLSSLQISPINLNRCLIKNLEIFFQHKSQPYSGYSLVILNVQKWASGTIESTNKNFSKQSKRHNLIQLQQEWQPIWKEYGAFWWKFSKCKNNNGLGGGWSVCSPLWKKNNFNAETKTNSKSILNFILFLLQFIPADPFSPTKSLIAI